ncbi:hypothetical protein [Chitinimonas naiadis]
MLTHAFIVQDKETGLFLYPHKEGDVGYTRLVTEAGVFDDVESALATADDYLHRGEYVIFEFWCQVH